MNSQVSLEKLQTILNIQDISHNLVIFSGELLVNLRYFVCSHHLCQGFDVVFAAKVQAFLRILHPSDKRAGDVDTTEEDDLVDGMRLGKSS